MENPWIGYVTRSYQQIKADVLTRFQSFVPEMTDHTEHNIFVRMVSIWAGLTEMIGYYLDNKGREAFLASAQLYSSAVKIANQYDYRVKGVTAASVDLRFSLAEPLAVPLVIAAGTQVQTPEGVIFVTNSTVTLQPGEVSISAPAQQRELVADIVVGQSTGQSNQSFVLDDDVVDNAITVTAGTVSYTPVDTLAFSSVYDSVFKAAVNEVKNMVILFGDNINGRIIPPGTPVKVTYFRSQGDLGNVAENTITELVSTPIPFPGGATVTVSNPQRAAGGAGVESLAELKRNIPLSIRTMDRAVTRQDYQDLGVLAPGVAKAAVLFDCGKTVDLYVAPNGGGVASSVVLNDVFNYFEPRRMVTTKVRIFPAGAVVIGIVADVVAKPKALNDVVKADTLARLLAFFNVDNQEIKGSVELSDLYEVIENTKDVQNSRIKGMTAIPYANIQSGTTPLLWDRMVLPESETVVKWKIQMLGPDTYQLFKAGRFVGAYETESELIFEDIQLNVQPNGYVLGDAWTFVTYPFFGSVVLEEMSIPVSFAVNIQLNVTGGA